MKRVFIVILLMLTLALPGLTQSNLAESDQLEAPPLAGLDTNDESPVVRSDCWDSDKLLYACYYSIAGDGLLTYFLQISTQPLVAPLDRPELPLLINAFHNLAQNQAITPETAAMLQTDNRHGWSAFIGRGDDSPMVSVSPAEYDAYRRWWAREKSASLHESMPPQPRFEDLYDEQYPMRIRYACRSAYITVGIGAEPRSACYESRASSGLFTFVMQFKAGGEDLPLASNQGIRLMQHLHRPEPTQPPRQ